MPCVFSTDKSNLMYVESYKVVNISYNNEFPYRKKYDTEKIENCHKFYKSKNNAVLRCREHITIIRPLSFIKELIKLQKKKKYFIFSISEFGIFNEKGKIISIQPADWFFKKTININKESHIVSGIFTRHTLDVRRYAFRRKGNNEVDYINTTTNHLFYVKNKGEFIPVNQIKSTDILINKNGDSIKPAKLFSGLNKHMVLNNTPKVVYNMELYTGHTYFVGKQQLLVHNTCGLEKYFKHLFEKEVLYVEKEKKSAIWIRVPINNMGILAADNEDIAFFRQNQSGFFKNIQERLKKMGFDHIRILSKDSGSQSTDYMFWKLGMDMTVTQYQTIIPFLSAAYTCKYEGSFKHLQNAIRIRYFTLIGSGSKKGKLCIVGANDTYRLSGEYLIGYENQNPVDANGAFVDSITPD